MISPLKLKHRLRCLQQRLSPPTLGVLGSYHGGNLGDMALGLAVLQAAEGRFDRAGLQTLHNLNSWPSSTSGLVGGGAVTQRGNLERLHKRYIDRPAKLGVVGVDIENWDALEEFKDFFSQIPVFGIRNRRQIPRLESVLGPERVSFAPDLVFSLQSKGLENLESKERSGVAIFNLCPRFIESSGDEICKDDCLESPVSFRTLDLGYRREVRNMAEACLADGLTVEHIPFTPADDFAAKSLLEGLPIKYRSYSDNVDEIIQAYTQADFSVASRYHSMIFSILSLCPVCPIAYADKSWRLLKDLDINEDCFVELNDLTGEKASAKIETLLSDKRPILGSQRVAEISRASRNQLSNALDLIGGAV